MLFRSMLKDKYRDESWNEKLQEIGAIVAAACLAHDLGNPPFGHSGEKAISAYFSEGSGRRLEQFMSEQEWNDLTHFEGNANSFRLLTHKFNGRRDGGYALTYSTLASIVKYPYASTHAGNKSKFGFFYAENEMFERIAKELELIKIEDKKYVRHPLVFLVEAADDICYQIMDIEDAHKLKLLNDEETKNLFFAYFSEERKASIERTFAYVTDINEQIAYMRSSVIGLLIEECSKVFVENESLLLSGELKQPLIKLIAETPNKAYKACSDVAYSRLYKSSDVVDIEIAGYQIISFLLDKFIDAIENPEKSYSKLLLDRIPVQYETEAATKYEKIMAILDFISGMPHLSSLAFYSILSVFILPSL